MGVRPHEALTLKARDVTDGYVTVTSKKKQASGRGGRRRLPLPKPLWKRLEAHVAELGSDDLVFGVTDVRNWRRRVFDRAVKKAGLPDAIVPYDLRHTCASKLIRLGKPAPFVAQWLGHSVTMTLTIYSHLFTGDLEEIAGALDRTTSRESVESAAASGRSGRNVAARQHRAYLLRLCEFLSM